MATENVRPPRRAGQAGSRRDTCVFEPGSFSGARRGCLFLQLLEQRLEASVPAQGREVGIVPHPSRTDRAMLSCSREKADRLLDLAESREMAGHVVEQDRIVRDLFRKLV